MAKKKEVDNSISVTKEDVGKATTSLLRRIVLGFAVIGILAAIVLGISMWKERNSNEEYNNDPQYSVNESDTQTTLVTVTENNGEQKEVEIQEKYKALLKINPEFVGKLYIDAFGEESGLNIVQGDDNEKYLTMGLKGETTRYGTLFVDYRNDLRNLDTNTIIYGHNMRDGAQLGALSLYEDIDNYKDFPTVKFNTIYGDNEWKIFAAFKINTKKEDDNGYVFPYLTTEFKSDEKFMEFIDDVKMRSYYVNETVDIQPDDKILTLSTCDTVFDGARFVLMARLVREGESADVDVDAAVENDNQRFPQAWYDKKGKENPFEDADNFTLD